MNLGGPAHQVTLLSSGLDAHGYRTLLISGRIAAGEEEHTEADEVTARYIDSLGPNIRPLDDVRALIELVRVIRSFRPDIVHTHTAKAGFLGRTAALVSMVNRPKVVHTYHGHVLRGYFGSLKTNTFRALEHALARVSDRLVGVSPATVDELVELGIAPRSRFEVVRLGLDLGAFLGLSVEREEEGRRELGVDAGEVLFTYTGRLVPIKRPDVMLRALAAARRARAPVKVAVVGDGGMRPELEALAVELGCADAVSFLGYRRDLPRIAAASDAALLTSDNEGTPVSLIEASAAARPAVATDVGGVADIVVEGTGFLAPAGDAAAIANRMAEFAADPATRRRMGARAREHVRQRYSAERLIADIDGLYARLLAPDGSDR